MAKLIFPSVTLAYCLSNSLHKETKQALVPVMINHESKGTSFSISKSGLALSSYHLTKAETLTNTENEFIQILHSDQQRDLVLLQLPRHHKYSYLKLAHYDQVHIGEPVLMFGFALNSLIGLAGYVQQKTESLLYTSVLMMHGQSGGPVVNSKGEVIGVNRGHMYCSPEKMANSPEHNGPSVHVPVRTVRDFLEQYCAEGKDGWELKTS
jgi:serine protease Do